jgi:hypothetical protein
VAKIKSLFPALICQVSALDIRMEKYAVDLNYEHSWLLAFLVGNSHYPLAIAQTTIETGDIQFAKNALKRTPENGGKYRTVD